MLLKEMKFLMKNMRRLEKKESLGYKRPKGKESLLNYKNKSNYKILIKNKKTNFPMDRLKI